MLSFILYTPKHNACLASKEKNKARGKRGRKEKEQLGRGVKKREKNKI
jgi:hypothetical protein